MRRREFITVISGAVVWPPSASAQQSEREGQIGVLIKRAIDNPEGQARLAAFKQALQQLGWNDGRNIRIERADEVTE